MNFFIENLKNLNPYNNLKSIHTNIRNDIIYSLGPINNLYDISDIIDSFSNEIKDILKKNKPNTVAQASSLPGFTPTATLLLLRHLKREKKQKVVNEY